MGSRSKLENAGKHKCSQTRSAKLWTKLNAGFSGRERYTEDQEVLDSRGVVQYVVQKDGSWRKHGAT
jgi:hypothetical protein